MDLSHFSFQLPSRLIAKYPLPERSGCRLLSLNGISGETTHGIFTDIIHQLEAGDLLVFNDTQVIAARLFGYKKTGGKLEILVERILDKHRVLAHIRSSKSPKVGAEIILGDDGTISAIMTARHGELFELRFTDDRDVLTILNIAGHIPLPPYIDRLDEDTDRERYQTVYSKRPGAVAAPTAGLHFDQAMLDALQQKGIEQVFITLHVGAGTFQPVRVDNIADHVMHAEYLEVPQTVIDAIQRCKARGKRVVAVGTTSVRSLETAAQASLAQGRPLAPFFGDTKIFIYPGYQYRLIDALITNFHLPESTLIMLVSAFAGYKHTMNAYRVAVEQQYQFFSYGDAMFITANPEAINDIPDDRI